MDGWLVVAQEKLECNTTTVTEFAWKGQMPFIRSQLVAATSLTNRVSLIELNNKIHSFSFVFPFSRIEEIM